MYLAAKQAKSQGLIVKKEVRKNEKIDGKVEESKKTITEQAQT